MGGTLCERRLQAIVVGAVVVREPLDVAQIGKLGMVRPSSGYGIAVGRTIVSGKPSQTSAFCRSGPSGSRQRLVDVGHADEI